MNMLILAFDTIFGLGEVAEWLKAPVSKTGIPDSGIAGSNPALSARRCDPRRRLFLPRASRTWIVGEVPEWLNGRAWKARVPGNRNRGFESRPLRHEVPGSMRVHDRPGLADFGLSRSIENVSRSVTSVRPGWSSFAILLRTGVRSFLN